MARYAAIDIGSNSVRMMTGESSPGSPPRILATDREVTRLGTSVFQSGVVSDEALGFVCAVLRRMGEAYRKFDVAGIRAVATAAIRDASNQEEFIERASQALGAPIEIISGQEEARLIWLGVQSRSGAAAADRVLILDVGGGSAEFIAGEKGELRDGISRPLGAVRLQGMFLHTDPPSTAELRRMEQFIEDKFQPALDRLEGRKFDQMIGTSATAAAIVSAVNRVPREQREAADGLRAKFGAIRKLYKELASRSVVDRRRFSGIGPRRAEIIVAGTAVFLRTMEALRQDCVQYSVAGVRDGILADLTARGVGRELSRLSRQQSKLAEAMCRKYTCDLRSARQVAQFSADLFDALAPLHQLSPEHGKLVQAAALLHDVGHYITDTGHHKHSAYIVANSDMPGFTDQERKMVALLCRYHRKSMPAMRHEAFRDLSPERRRTLLLLTPLVRLAVALDTSKEQKVEAVTCRVWNGGVSVHLQGKGNFDLEAWAAERAADVFRQVYNVSMTIER